MSKLKKFLVLPLQDKYFILLAIFYLTYYRLALKTCSFKSLLMNVEKRSTTRSNISFVVGSERLIKYISVASKFIPGTTCLSKALAGKVLLSVYTEINPDLHIGIAKGLAHSDGGIEAHAWLSCNGKIILCELPEMDHFTELAKWSGGH